MIHCWTPIQKVLTAFHQGYTEDDMSSGHDARHDEAKLTESDRLEQEHGDQSRRPLD